jgi:thymidine kinase
MAKLYFYYSAMNAGKTTVLLQSAHNYRERGMHPLLFKPRLDDRYSDNLFDDVRTRLADRNVHCVLVDEAQFLTRDQVYQLTEVVDRLNIPVLCFGLRTDFQGELFEGSRYLLAWADQLEELKTICHTGRKATMVVRVDEAGYAVREGSQVESRREFKEVFFGGKRIKLIDPLEQPAADADAPQEALLD